MKGTTRIQQLIDAGEMIMAIGAHDALSAILIEQAGFNAIYVGSFATEATFMGNPDIGLMSKTERLMIAGNIAKAVGIPVIVDMETGYGNAINLIDVVRDSEAAGLAGIQIEDQVIPPKCPFLTDAPTNPLISVEEMCGRIRAGIDAREDSSFKIIVRSNVIGTVPIERYYQDGLIEEVVRRSNAYAAAGADVIFVNALSADEVHYFADAIRAPLMGMFSPSAPLPISLFEEVGYQMVIGSVCSLHMAARGLIDGLRDLRETRDWGAIQDRLITDEEFASIVHSAAYAPLYDRYQIP
jgi:2-methylisocitrate lyase-like PEP mutase family enzyme